MKTSIIRFLSLLIPVLLPCSVMAAGDVDLQLAMSSNRYSAAVGDSIVYTVQYNCVSTTADGLNVVLTDTIDQDLDFVSLRNSPHVASSSFNAVNRKITVNFVNPLPAGSSGDIQITCIVKPSAVAGIVVKNKAEIDGSNAKKTSQSNEVQITISGGGGGLVFSPEIYVYKNHDGELALPNDKLTYYINHGNKGAAGENVTNYYIEDIWPVGLKMESFRTGRFTMLDPGDVRNIAITYQKNTTGSTWHTWPGAVNRFTSNVNVWVSVSELGLPASEYVTGIRMSYGMVPGGGSYHPDASGYINTVLWLRAASGSPIAVGDVIRNCAYARASGLPAKESCIDTAVVAGKAVFHFWDRDDTSTPPYNPGDTIRLGMTVGQDDNSSIAMVNPGFNYLLPNYFSYIGNVTMAGEISYGMPTVGAPIDDYAGTGRQMIRFSWPGKTLPALALDQDLIVYFDVKIEANAPFGVHVPEVFSGWTSPDGEGYSWMVTDEKDYDGDGLFTDLVAKDTSYIQVGDAGTGLAILEAEKWVKGELDSDYSKYPSIGVTVPGGQADYRLVLKNAGEVALKRISVIEIFPSVGDKGVIDTAARGSEWGPVLVGAVAAPAGATVYYSQSSNPCRNELTPGLPAGCEDPKWDTSPPADITTVRSLKFDFGEYWLMPKAETIIEWPMRAPLSAPTGGEIAWSSFGIVTFRADNNVRLLPTEPLKVGISIQAPEPPFFGDFVWSDLDRDGIQDPGEPGVNGVRVELYEDNGDGVADPSVDELYDFTVTVNDGTSDGKYLFPFVPPADYFAVYYLPEGFKPTRRDQGGNDELDSDGIAAFVVDRFRAVTPVTTITDLEEDYSWDQGMYDATMLPEVYTMAEQSDGKVIIGGRFFSSHGVPRSNIARLNANGTVDTSFDPGAGCDGIVCSIAIRPDGNIIVGGEFTQFNGQTVNGLVLLKPDGKIHTKPASPNYPTVRWVAALGDNRMVVGGEFTSIGGGGGPFLAVLKANGSVDNSFHPSPGPDGPVHSGSVVGGGIVIGGSFGKCNGQDCPSIAKLNLDGTNATGFNPGAGANGPVNSVTIKGGEIFIVGDFSSVGGHAVSGAARLGADGTVDVSFGSSGMNVNSNKASQ